jgi:signal peptidase II
MTQEVMTGSKTMRERAKPVLLIAALVFIADQASKYWLIHGLGLGDGPPIRLGEYFALVMAWNKGVSFSMFAHSTDWMPWVLTFIAVLISCILLRLALHTPKRQERIGYAMVIGGALGNACDRARFGAVADFFYAHIGTLGWPAFNVADMAICTGVGLLLLAMIKQK